MSNIDKFRERKLQLEEFKARRLKQQEAERLAKKPPFKVPSHYSPTSPWKTEKRNAALKPVNQQRLQLPTKFTVPIQRSTRQPALSQEAASSQSERKSPNGDAVHRPASASQDLAVVAPVANPLPSELSVDSSLIPDISTVVVDRKSNIGGKRKSKEPAMPLAFDAQPHRARKKIPEFWPQPDPRFNEENVQQSEPVGQLLLPSGIAATLPVSNAVTEESSCASLPKRTRHSGLPADFLIAHPENTASVIDSTAWREEIPLQTAEAEQQSPAIASAAASNLENEDYAVSESHTVVEQLTPILSAPPRPRKQEKVKTAKSSEVERLERDNRFFGMHTLSSPIRRLRRSTIELPEGALNELLLENCRGAARGARHSKASGGRTFRSGSSKHSTPSAGGSARKRRSRSRVAAANLVSRVRVLAADSTLATYDSNSSDDSTTCSTDTVEDSFAAAAAASSAEELAKALENVCLPTDDESSPDMSTSSSRLKKQWRHRARMQRLSVSDTTGDACISPIPNPVLEIVFEGSYKTPASILKRDPATTSLKKVMFDQTVLLSDGCGGKEVLPLRLDFDDADSAPHSEDNGILDVTEPEDGLGVSFGTTGLDDSNEFDSPTY